MPDFEIRVLFRDSAWRWRLGPTDEVELWTGPRLLGSIPGALVTAILRDYLNKLALLSHFQDRLADSLRAPPRPEGPSTELRKNRRAARRKPLKKALLILVVTALSLIAGCATHWVLIEAASERAHAEEVP